MHHLVGSAHRLFASTANRKVFCPQVSPAASPSSASTSLASSHVSCRPSRATRAVRLSKKVQAVAEAPQVVHSSSAPGAVILETATPNRATVLRNIVFVSSEAAPWSKTGGLGDVMGSLPAALAARGHRVMVVAPLYSPYSDVTFTEKRVDINGSEVGYWHKSDRGVDWVFVEHPSFPRPGGLYADQFGAYGDNQFRYTLLTLAGLEAPLHLTFEKGMYGQDIVFVANDWHTSLVSVYLAAKYRPHGVYRDARSILAIHNLKHQGVFPPGTFESLGLPGQWYGALEWQYPPHQRQGSYAEEGRSVNHMKAGIITADRIVTVSAGYAEEVKTYLGGWGLDGLLYSRNFVLNGITNGIDMDEWNPAIDPAIPKNYDITNYVEGKRICKLELQKELGLPQNVDIPLVAFIGRLDSQKGADILLQAAPELLSHSDVQLVCLGSGTSDLEDGLRWLERTFPNRARGWVGFNVPFSHRLTAAADILLMPSRFEPCGLNQLYAMRYGAVPVAHRTGGLKDTVIDFDPWAKKGTGWTYSSCDRQGLMHALGLALHTFKHHMEDFRSLQRRGMERDSSWDIAAQQYEQIFSWAKIDDPYAV